MRDDPIKRALEHQLSEAGAELGAALMQVLPGDNQIIVEHMRAAQNDILAAAHLLRVLEVRV